MPPVDQAVTNGAMWLRAVFHGYCCCKHSCCSAECRGVRDILAHLHTVPAHAKEHAHHCATPLRQLQAHYVQCQDPACPLCGPIYCEVACGGHQAAVKAEDAQVPDGDHASAPTTPFRIDEQTRQPASDAGADSDEELDDMDCLSDSSSGWGDESTLGEEDWESPADEFDDVDAGMPADTTPDPAALQPSCSKGLRGPAVQAYLVPFAQFLLQSLLRWPAANPCVQQGYEEVHAGFGAGGVAVPWLLVGRQLWAHLLCGCPRMADDCAHPGCTEARKVLLHLLQCEDPSCGLCGPVCSAFRPACNSPREAGILPTLPQELPDLLTSVPLHSLTAWFQEVGVALQTLGL